MFVTSQFVVFVCEGGLRGVIASGYHCGLSEIVWIVGSLGEFEFCCSRASLGGCLFVHFYNLREKNMC